MVGKQNDIGKLIRERRKEKGLTLVELGEIIGVANGTISKWERGQIKNMRRDKIQALCDVLCIPPYTFISGTYKDEKMTHDVSIGLFIKNKRKEKGLTLEQVGNYVVKALFLGGKAMKLEI